MAVEISDHLAETVLAVGALGTASYGVVDTMKLIPAIDLAGFSKLFTLRQQWSRVGPAGGKTDSALDPLLSALVNAYGPDAMDLMKTQYRAGRSKGDLPTTLRQGVRIGFGFMGEEAIRRVAEQLGIDSASASDAARTIVRMREASSGQDAKTTSTAEQNATARLETMIDARIDSALVLAERQFELQAKFWATCVALTVAIVVGVFYVGASPWVSAIIGLAAVPLAPIAKDLSSAIQAATQALRAK